MALSSYTSFVMEFPERLSALRKARGMKQQALADAAYLAVLQIRRHVGGNSQPALDVICCPAIALGVSADMLVFNELERATKPAAKERTASSHRSGIRG